MIRKTSCPKCKKPTKLEKNPHRPFCSERCQLIDLGDWADEKYGIPVENESPDLGEPSNDDSNFSPKNNI